jgi:hypothetical protein
MPVLLLPFVVRARPWPIVWLGHQACFDWIIFDVRANALEFGGGTNPMIEGLVLPEGFPNAIQELIGLACGDSFYSVRNSRQRTHGVEQEVDVVGHYSVSVQCEAPLSNATKDRFLHDSGELGLVQPVRPRGCGIKMPVGGNELLSRRLAKQLDCAQNVSRQGTVQPPGDEDGAVFRLPVRQVAIRIAHWRDTTPFGTSRTGIPACPGFFSQT